MQKERDFYRAHSNSKWACSWDGEGTRVHTEFLEENSISLMYNWKTEKEMGRQH
jgi:hypothetical protein